MHTKYLIFVILTIYVSIPYAHAEKETVNERLIRVEESIKSLDLRLTQQIDLLRKDIDRRFDDSSKDVDDMRSLIYVVIASLFSIIALICALIVFIVRKDKQTVSDSANQNDFLIVLKKIESLEHDFRETIQQKIELLEMSLKKK